MGVAETNFEQVVESLAKARQAMRNLLALSGDWTVRCQIQAEFDHLERDCRDFAQQQLFLGADCQARKAP
jgi:hypothetical protein